MTIIRACHLNPTTTGGAGRAAYRIHHSLNAACSNVSSQMLVFASDVSDASIRVYKPSSLESLLNKIHTRYEFLKLSKLQTSNFNFHSTCYPGSSLPNQLNRSDAHILNLHSLGNGFLSIEDVPRFVKPVVWTMHDEWGYCGSEHYSEADQEGINHALPKRFESGYLRNNRALGEAGPDLNRKTWLRKLSSWKVPFHIVCPSSWLADSASRSKLMASWPIRVIPYSIDCDVWKPIDSHQSRKILGLPCESKLILFGADHGTANPRKGADLLVQAMRLLNYTSNSPLDSPKLVVFGQQLSMSPDNTETPYYFLGRLLDDISLRIAYSAADVIVVPSRQDNLPNIGLEAHACGKPVVAFRTGGLPDIIEDRLTGALAEPFDPHSLAEALSWVLSDPLRTRQLGDNARRRAQSLWSPPVVASQYASLYSSILDHS